MSVLNLMRSDLQSWKSYSVNKDNISSRLHANELPWSPFNELNLNTNQYPGYAKEAALSSILTEHYGVSSNQLLITRGSDEALDFIMRLFLQPGLDSILQCPPTFAMYEFYARLQQGNIINVPLSPINFSYQLESICNNWEPNCKLIFLCTPNNPTGSSLPIADIERLCLEFQNKAMIVVDEAYIEFSSRQSAASLIAEFDNLIVLRTLSKAHGLAALRLGCILTQESCIKALLSIRAPYPLSEIVLDIAQQALRQTQWQQEAVAIIVSERQRFAEKLQEISYIEAIYPSEANFLLVGAKFALDIRNWLQAKGIAVRAFTDPTLQNFLRITIGHPEQNQELLAALQAYSPRMD